MLVIVQYVLPYLNMYLKESVSKVFWHQVVSQNIAEKNNGTCVSHHACGHVITFLDPAINVQIGLTRPSENRRL